MVDKITDTKINITIIIQTIINYYDCCVIVLETYVPSNLINKF